ncbi:Hsp70 family protein [Rhodococcus sp. BP-252]|uniref:Hsp70 family protein n=2 Tax=unclassified Rhodococcus (in: high G+C Gram-positive bacteria) TaxID=192944 RepID=UPI00143062F8|nr:MULTISPECIES: Hsp70 family protein [unclassified Rhodococcus (in: high G+C Gram-positive bacteria)]MBY6414884.1 Hsp70 family protein [Rhodococcus sp. BP-320]MBY6419847.1 Hsp70 family protein [Rhodococcus sp. BP-321]MBY6424819.1 Hsp70 family protein [Rhodococcus sp. BP-324]MBY6429779.1 Hsp70 family protein [Rhodococcus sp. BP-323]MBY6434740.1 Hsp70 family protein [Rhodococcus sp. BP-322]MBY6443568.1 Hsp70 family protein [Rhodococcus sp. BP-319]MBY6448338.1 Hsp70 family protein [Rhodococcus
MVSIGMSMGASGIRAVRTADGVSFSAEWFPSAADVPDADDVAHAIRTIVDRSDAPHSLGVAFPDPSYSAALKAALVEEYVSEVHIISEIAGTLEQLRADPDFRYRTVAIYDLGATGLDMTVADTDSGTVYAATRSQDFSGDVLDLAVRDYLMTLDILATPRTPDEEAGLLAFSREIKEALSTHEATQTSDGAFRLMDRRMFEICIMRAVERSAIALRDLAEMSEIPPEAVVAIGGGARIPLIEDILGRYLQLPVVRPDAPDLIASRGAALYATRVDGVRNAAAPPARRSAKSLLTPLLRFGLPSVVAFGLLSWVMWPSPEAESTMTRVPAPAVDTSSTPVTATQLLTTLPPPAPVVENTPTIEAPPAETQASAPSVPSYDTGGYVEPAAPPPPPPPFQLPRIELPQIQLPVLPPLRFP